MAEKVLVVPTSFFRELGSFQGFTAAVGRYSAIFNHKNQLFMRRADAECDTHFKQLIPYVLIAYGSQVFCYTRGKGQGEARLHAKRSLGIGGHVNPELPEMQVPGPLTYRHSLLRELEEEVDLGSGYQEVMLGMINDDETAVGAVHLGVVHMLRLATPKVSARETEIRDAGLVEWRDLVAQREQFEPWSQICIDQFAKVYDLPQLQ